MTDRAIRAAKLTLGAVLDKRRAQTAKDRAGGQIAPSKYLPNVPRQFHADGGVADDDNQPVDLGAAREQKQLQGFHKVLMGDMASAAAERMDAHQKAIDAGVFDGYEVGDTLQGSVHPMRITGRFVRPWKPSVAVLSHFDRVGVKPTIIEHNGKQYIPMLRYQTGKEGVDGFQEGDSYLDMVKHLGYRKMGGLRAVRADGGRIHANKGGKMGARADFLAGNHPEVPSVVYHSTKSDFKAFNPMSHFGTRQAAHDRYSPDGRLNEGMSVIPAHISLKNPLDVGLERDWQSNRDTIRQAADAMFKSGRLDQDYLKAAEKLYDLVDDPRWGNYHQAMEQRGADLLREAGHDGIIYTNNIEDPGSRSFVTLHPSQVKSAIGNRGTFDPTHPDMTKKDGGEVDGDDGIDAYHGSPHDFDQFDIGKLGTGEGAQAYGHGLYFAGNEGIARHYRDTLSDPNAPLGGFKMRDGRDMDILHVPDGIYSLLNGRYQNADYDKLMSAAQEKLNWAQTRKGQLRDVHSKNAQAVIDFLRANEGMRFERNPARGTMYKVKLNVKPHELLDWDAPLSDQPAWQKVRQHWDDTKGDPDIIAQRLGLDESSTGRQLHEALSGYDRSGQAKAASALSAAGLKGIRYRDASSREDDKDGDPTHNYVMFHHDPVKVVDKYEYGGVVKKSGGGSMGDNDKPVDLGAARAMRNFNQNSTGPTPEAEGVFNRLAAGQDAAASAHEAAIRDGAFNNAQIGDVFRYKPLENSTPMKVVGHGMVHVSRWGGINPPTRVYQDHFPVAEMKSMDASTERRKYPIEMLEDRSRYDFLSGKPRIARADGGRLNLYSKAARIIAGMKDQPMQAADIVKYAIGKGAKKTEMAHVDVPPGKATPKQVADHIEFMQPQIGVHRRETFYRYNDPERYERQINYLEGQGRYDEAEELNREYEAFSGFGGKDAPLYAKYQLPGGENYREHVLTLDSHPDDQTYMAKQHWGRMKNPLVHVRMSDRMIGNKKILHIEELQSDWNNDARKEGFRTGREKSDYDAYVAKMRQDAIAGIDRTAAPMIRQALEQKYSAMDPYMLAMKMGVQGEHNQLANAAFMGDKKPPQAPYINPDRDDASEVGMKHILMEAAKGGYDGIAFTPDEAQEQRWPGHTFKGIYNKKLPGMAQRLVQQHDPETDPDDMTHLQGWAVPMIPLSDKARDSIMQNGFSSFKRGGVVDAALAATRRFTKDGQHVTMRLKD